MPPVRRRPVSSRRRRRRSRPRVGLLLVVVLLGGYMIYGGLIVRRQIAGYFETTHRRTVTMTGRHTPPVTTAVATPSATPPPPVHTPFHGPTPVPESGPVLVPHFQPAKPSGARIAIIIDDCGNNMERERPFLKLPIPLTMSVLPLTPHAREIAQEAALAGKSVMLHLPMEPESAAEHPGPGAVTTAMSDDEVQAQVQTDIASLPYVPGANNHMGSKATSDARVMRDVLEVMLQNHLFFIDSVTSHTSVGFTTARDLGVRTAARDVFLDNTPSTQYVEAQLEIALTIALKQGEAIAIGHPNAATAQGLAALIPKFQSAGIAFVPAQALVH